MIDQKVIDYIKNSKEKDKLSDEEIKKNLLSAGWQEQEINKIFQYLDGSLGKEPPKVTGPSGNLTEEQKASEEFLKEEGFIEKPRRFNLKLNKKYLKPLIILVALVSIIGASALIYGIFSKPDPISLLPQDTGFYIRFKIDPKNDQVKNFKDILSKFPYYEKLSQNIEEYFERLKEENPSVKNIDLNISDEIILSVVSPFSENMTDFPLVIIFPDPDLKKLEKLAKDIQKEIEKDKSWKIEQETYKGRILFKAGRVDFTEPEVVTAITNGHFLIAPQIKYIKKVIDVADDQKITNIFKKIR